MILRGLEIIEHAKVHVAKMFLASDCSIERGREYVAATDILERAGDALLKDLANQQPHLMLAVSHRGFLRRTTNEH